MASLGMATTFSLVLAPKLRLPSMVKRVGTSTILRTTLGSSRISLESNRILRFSSTTDLGLEASLSTSSVKDFLEDLKSVGRVRIIVNTGVGVLESVVSSLDSLFYKEFAGKGEYANLMVKAENVDFHLLVDKVASAKLIQGKSMQGNIPTYMVRFFDSNNTNVASIMVMWRMDGDGNEYDNGQIDSFNQLLAKYGSDLKFSK